jgi:hypothetical protein
LVIVLAAVELVEVRSAVHTEQHGFTVEYKRANADTLRCLYDERISIGPVVAVPREQSNALALPMNGKAVAIVLISGIQSGPAGTALGRQTRANSTLRMPVR